MLSDGLLLLGQGFFAGVQGFDDGIGVEDTTAPYAARCGLERGPESGVVGHLRVRGQVFGGWTVFEFLGAPIGAVVGVVFADEVYGAGEVVAVNDDFDEVAFVDSADGSVGEGFGSDVSDACTGGYAGEAGVGDECNVLAVGEVFECCSDLVDLFHAGAEGAAASEDHDVASFDLERLVAGLDGSGGVAFGGEDAGIAGVAVYAVVIDDCWVDGGGLDDGAFWCEVSAGECDGAG